jgi:predicted RNase H-like nuclease
MSGQVGSIERAVLGIDAAWTATAPSGVALAVEGPRGWRLAAVDASYDHFVERAAGTEPGLGRPRGAIAEAARLVEAVRGLVGRAPDCVAIDMPVGRSPITRRRRCDDEISRAYGGRKAAVHSPTRDRPGAISDALSACFATIGFPVCVDPPAHGLIEVYPHAALIELMGEKERLPYKAGKTTIYWRGLLLEERHRKLRALWARIVEALDAHIAGVAAKLPVPASTDAGWRLKTFEDKLDAVVCAAVAIAAPNGEAVPIPDGDEEGAIWVPKSAGPKGAEPFRREGCA